MTEWKIGIHLLFRTKRFGVNNQWWSNFDSIFGWGNIRKAWAIIRIYPIVRNYSHMKYRAGACCFLTEKKYKEVFCKQTQKGRTNEE